MDGFRFYQPSAQITLIICGGGGGVYIHYIQLPLKRTSGVLTSEGP